MNHQALIVDDEPDIRELLELTLGRMNIETRSAANLNGYGRFLCALAREEKLLPMASDGVARAIEHAARLASRRDRLCPDMDRGNPARRAYRQAQEIVKMAAKTAIKYFTFGTF